MAQTRGLLDSVTGTFGLNNDVAARAVDALQACEAVVIACVMGMLAEETSQHLLTAVGRDLKQRRQHS